MSSPRSYYRGSHGAILVYDSSKKQSLFDLGCWISQLAKETRIVCTPVCALWGGKSEASHYETDPVTQDTVDDFQVKYGNTIPKEHWLCAEVDDSNIMEEFQKLVHKLHYEIPVEQTLQNSSLHSLEPPVNERSCPHC